MADSQSPLLSRDRIDNHDGHSENSEDAVSNTDYGSGVYRYPVYLQPGQFTSLEKLMFFVSSILFILLCVFTGLYARSSYNENPKKSPHPPVPIPLPPTKNTTEALCLEPHCIQSAASILQDVNLNIDPCNDFYAYTCSHWIDRHLLPDTHSKISVHTLAKDSIRQYLDQILSRDMKPMGDTTTPFTNNLPSPDRIIDRQLFNKLTTFYTACMDEDTVEKMGVTPLYQLFHSIQEMLPSISYQMSENTNATLYKEPAFVQKLSQAVGILSQHHIEALFEMKIIPDPYHPTKTKLSLGQGDVGLPSREYYDDPEVFSTYMEVVTELLEIVFREDKTGQFGWKSLSPIATARRILEFEKQLAQVKYHTMTAKNTTVTIEEWSLEKLHSVAPNFNWTLYIEAMLPRGVPMPFTLLIPSPHFITSLSNDVLENTNVRTLQMYLVWRTLWKYLDTLGEVYVAPRRKLMAKINGIEARAKPMRWNTCLSHLDQSLGLLMGHYFVRSLDKDSKAKSEELASKIAESFVDSLSHLAWVDDTTRQEMVAKVQAIHYQLGYPTSSPDILSLVALSEFYSNVNIVQDSLFANVQSANRWKVKQQWAQLGKPVVHGIWKANPQDVQAYYTRQQNEMIVPAGLLQPPFYNAQGPEYLNYGSLGWMVGQNILHGFDPVGRHYNGQGELGHWWSDSSLVGFDNRTSCFAKQYSEFTLEGPRGELYSVDGQRTLNANLADNGALKKAYAAWLLRFESKHYNNSPLPGLEQWTVEQLFYINFGRMACSKSTSENDVREIRTSETAPDKWRVNGPLINSPHFSKVFQCPLGSPMNPVVKCNLW